MNGSLFAKANGYSSFSQASYAPIRALHGYAAAWDGSPSAGADGRGLFPCANFFASSLILLSPKRAMRQSVLRTDAQPLGTRRQPLNAVGRLILLSPKRCLYVNYARFARIMRRPLWTGRHLLKQMDVVFFHSHLVFVFFLYVHPPEAECALMLR